MKKRQLFHYDNENLVYRKTNRLLKYRVIVAVLFLSVSLLSFVAVKKEIKKEQLKEIISKKDSIILAKERRIEKIKTPLRKETYVEDLYSAISFKLTEEQYKKFSYLSLKYRNQIEEAHIPATLVWWIAFKESRFDINAKSSESTAKGMFQFLDGTWDFCCKMAGENKNGRFNEEKQVRILLTYLNYLYNKYGSWQKSMVEYHGGEYQYPIKFLFK